MRPNALRVRDDLTIARAATFFSEHEISAAPVEDSGGRLIGVVSMADIAGEASGREPAAAGRRPDFFSRDWECCPAIEDVEKAVVRRGDLPVRDVMTPGVYSVPEETPVADVAMIMLDSHFHRLIVTHGSRAVGIVSSNDLLGLLVGLESRHS